MSEVLFQIIYSMLCGVGVIIGCYILVRVVSIAYYRTKEDFLTEMAKKHKEDKYG